MNKDKTPIRKMQVNFYAPYEIITSAEGLARPLELAQRGDEIVRAWLGELKQKARPRKVMTDISMSPDNLDASTPLVFPLLLTASIWEELAEAGVQANIDPMAWGSALLWNWQSDLMVDEYRHRSGS